MPDIEEDCEFCGYPGKGETIKLSRLGGKYICCRDELLRRFRVSGVSGAEHPDAIAPLVELWNAAQALKGKS